jgi:hypothetical protein
MGLLALSPHTSDDGAVDAGDNANSPRQFDQLALRPRASRSSTAASSRSPGVMEHE